MKKQQKFIVMGLCAVAAIGALAFMQSGPRVHRVYESVSNDLIKVKLTLYSDKRFTMDNELLETEETKASYWTIDGKYEETDAQMDFAFERLCNKQSCHQFKPKELAESSFTNAQNFAPVEGKVNHFRVDKAVPEFTLYDVVMVPAESKG